MRVADYIFKTLADRGVKHVFLVTGGGAMFLNDALGHEGRIQPICTHHEQGAAIAAEGYARTTDGFSVVCVTTGPGGTNTLTGVIGEWLDSQPVLYISGQVKYSTTIDSQHGLPLRQLGDQEINIVDIVRPVTKYAKMIVDPQSIRYELEKALALMRMNRPGPVWLDIPINIQSAQIDPCALKAFDGSGLPPSPVLNRADVADALSALMHAKSPVIVAGQGIRLAGAAGLFENLVQTLKIPVLGTFNGFDLLPSASPYAIGRIGTIGTRAGNIALQNADWVLCLGTRNNIRQVSYNYENFAKRAKTVVCVDVDAAELNKSTVRATLKICADAKDFISAFRQMLGRFPVPDWHSWLGWNQERRLRYAVTDGTRPKSVVGVDPYAFTCLLTRTLPADSVVSCANATPSLALFQCGEIKAGQRMFANSGCAAMGFGLPAAVGASVAAQDERRPVICLEGDGSLMMNLQELQTVRHHNLNVKLFLFNNGEYCSIRQTQDNFFHRRTGCDKASGISFPDWEKIASAFGIPYFEIAGDNDVPRLLPSVLNQVGPVFCNVRLSEGYKFEPKLSSRVLPDGTMVSASLEDMFPFLSPEEMETNCYVSEKA